MGLVYSILAGPMAAPNLGPPRGPDFGSAQASASASSDAKTSHLPRQTNAAKMRPLRIEMFDEETPSTYLPVWQTYTLV